MTKQGQSYPYVKSVANLLRGAQWSAVLGGVVILGVIFSLLSPAFLEIRNLENILVQAAVTGVMAVGMTYVIMTAGIDISVGAILYLTAAVVAEIFSTSHSPLTSMFACIVVVCVGMILGVINGFLTNILNINPLITTLGTYTIYRGLAIHITHAQIIILPGSVRFFGVGKIANIPAPLLTVIITGVIGAIILNYTRFGRHVLAVGSSQRSARESGLPVDKVLVAVYGIAGLCAGLAALILIGQVGAIQSDMGIGIEFTVITAVVLGGTNLFGGRGSIVGSLIGAVLLVMIDNGLNLINASPFIYDIVRGTVLVGAVVIDRLSGIQQSRLKLLSRANVLGSASPKGTSTKIAN